MWFVLSIVALLFGILCWSVWSMVHDFDRDYKADKIERGVSPAQLEPLPSRKLQID